MCSQDVTPSPNSWSPASVGVENAAGSEGMQISYDDPTFPSPNSAFMIGKTCGRSKTMFSIGWCPNYCPGSDPSACPGVTIQNTCDYDYGDRFCQDNCESSAYSLRCFRLLTLRAACRRWPAGQHRGPGRLRPCRRSDPQRPDAQPVWGGHGQREVHARSACGPEQFRPIVATMGLYRRHGKVVMLCRFDQLPSR